MWPFSKYRIELGWESGKHCYYVWSTGVFGHIKASGYNFNTPEAAAEAAKDKRNALYRADKIAKS